MALTDTIKAKAISVAVNKAFDMLYDDFDGNLPKVRAMIDKFSGSGDNINAAQLRLFNMVMDYLETPGNNWRQLVLNVIEHVDKEVARTFLLNFFVNSVTIGGYKQRRVNEAEDCNCPWAILMDPTTACNLHCNGCWAGHYESSKHHSMTFDELDSIITQGKEMGTYIYLYTGGEPMMRKRDIIRLCEKHPDCFFSAFTNGTLVDEAFADEVLRVKNFMPAFSIEGFEEATDSRRGQGTFQKVTHAMDIMRERRLPFGASICYTSQNYDSITSDEFIQFLVDKGVLFSWIFTYMPVGVGAPVELLATASVTACTTRSVRTGVTTCPSSSPTSGTTASTRAAASPVPVATCTSMPPATSSPAPSSTTPIPTSARRACWSATRARSSRAISSTSPSTATCCVPARCWTTPACSPRWSTRPAPSPRTTRSPRTSTS